MGALSLEGPRLPVARPPTKLWSSSTTPLSSSRSGRTIARRNLCSHAQAVSYEPNPSASFRPCAETPFFCEVTNQTAANHVESGVCERCKMVPAVTEVFLAHAAHIHKPLPVRQPPPEPHSGQVKPPGQRRFPRYSRQAVSSGNQALNSW
jgi:hypothetical protein